MTNTLATHPGGLIADKERQFDLCEALNLLAHDWGLYDVKARLDRLQFSTRREKYTDLSDSGKLIYDIHHSWLKAGNPRLRSMFAPTTPNPTVDYLDLLPDSPDVLHFMMYDEQRDRYTSAAFCHRCEGWTVFGDALDCEHYGLTDNDLPIYYSSCTHDDSLCPDCNTNLHPGCCGEDA